MLTSLVAFSNFLEFHGVPLTEVADGCTDAAKGGQFCSSPRLVSGYVVFVSKSPVGMYGFRLAKIMGGLRSAFLQSLICLPVSR